MECDSSSVPWYSQVEGRAQAQDAGSALCSAPRGLYKQGMTSAAPHLRRVGLVSVPFKGVPPAGPGSIAYIAHQLTRRLTDQADWTVIGGTWERAPNEEHAGIDYHAVSDRLDRWCLDRWRALDPRPANRALHPYHRPGFRQSYARQAARILRQRNCDQVLSMIFPQWLPVLRAALPTARLLYWAQDMTFAAFPQRFTRCLEMADGLIACSALVRQRYVEAFPFLEDRAWVVPNGFDPQCFQPSPKAPANPPRGPCILYAGRMTPEKGVQVLVQAFAMVADQFPDAELRLVGPPWLSDPRLLPPWDAALISKDGFCADLSGRLAELAGAAADRLVLAGSLSRPSLARAYRDAAIVVQPSLWEEPFGMPALEAMACGAAVVVTEPGGHAEFVADGRTGRIVPRGEVADLAQVLRELLADAPLRQQLGRQAAAEVLARYSWDQVAVQLAAVLDDGQTESAVAPD